MTILFDKIRVASLQADIASNNVRRFELVLSEAAEIAQAAIDEHGAEDHRAVAAVKRYREIDALCDAAYEAEYRAKARLDALIDG